VVSEPIDLKCGCVYISSGQRRIVLCAKHDGAYYARLAAELEMAWGIIANAGGGDWSKETPEWQEAAAKWRDDRDGGKEGAT
jgi:hypothetical protein